MADKRKTPEWLQNVLTVDKSITKMFCGKVEKFLPLPKYRKYYKALEYSCHTLPWIFGSLAALWLLWNEDLFQTQVNLMFGLVLSLMVHWCAAKLFEDRPPRVRSDGRLCCPQVRPSRGVTVATFISSFFCYLRPLWSTLRLSFKLWAASVYVSQVVTQKHKFLDLFIAAFLGYLTSFLMSYLWLAKDTCRFCLTLEARPLCVGK